MPLESNQRRDIKETLSQIGLTSVDQDAYIALLELGVTTATPLAHALSVPLSTAQSSLQRLATLGVVHVTKRKSRSVYEAKDPQIFKTLLEQRLQDVGQIIPLLKSLRTEQTGPARIRIYTRERATDIFRQALLSKDKMVYEIVSAKDIQDVLGNRFHFTKRRMENNIHLKSLRVEAYEIKKYSRQSHLRELREAKFLPKDFVFQGSVLFWDQTVAFFTPLSEGLIWIVHSTSFVLMMRQIFDMLWSVSRKMETAQE